MTRKQPKPSKVPITERALVQRINRKLQQPPNPEILRAARTDRDRLQLGDYYVVDLSLNAVMNVNVDLTKLAQELGVLKPWEGLESK